MVQRIERAGISGMVWRDGISADEIFDGDDDVDRSFSGVGRVGGGMVGAEVSGGVSRSAG